MEACLDSVRGQTFTAWEHIVVDSLSTDGTIELVQRHIETDTRIKMISEKDFGIYDAMNQGIRHTRGEWIYFLGSDDQFHRPDVLTSFLEAKSDQADLVYGNVLLVPGGIVYDGPFDLNKLFVKNISHQAIFYRRSLFARFGLFDLRFPVCADWDFNLRCFSDPEVRCQFIDLTVADFYVGGASSAGANLDPGWKEERIKLLAQRLGLGPEHSAALTSIITLIQGEHDVAIRELKKLSEKKYASLVDMNNDLRNSVTYRVGSALISPIRSAKRLVLGNNQAAVEMHPTTLQKK